MSRERWQLGPQWTQRWRDEKHTHQGFLDKLHESVKRTDVLVQASLFLAQAAPLILCLH